MAGSAVNTSFNASVPPVEAPIAIILFVVLISALLFRGGGGGGYGNPLDRDPRRVLKDVINDYISLISAKENYGVIIRTPEMVIDESATFALRKQMSERG